MIDIKPLLPALIQRVKDDLKSDGIEASVSIENDTLKLKLNVGQKVIELEQPMNRSSKSLALNTVTHYLKQIAKRK